MTWGSPKLDLQASYLCRMQRLVLAEVQSNDFRIPALASVKYP